MSIEKIKEKIAEYNETDDAVKHGCANGMQIVLNELEKYVEGYDILNEFWDCIPDEEKDDVHERLNEIGL